MPLHLDQASTSAPFLAALASQHHRSDYNRLKFGPNGAPFPYKPLSLHTPDLFSLLLLRQARTQHIQVWWLCKPSSSLQSHVPVFGPTGPQSHDDLSILQPLILAAILEPIHAGLALHPSIKTSISHPLNISPIIPPHLIPLVSSTLSFSTTPTLFTIPLSFSLDHLLTCHGRSNRPCLEFIDANLPEQSCVNPLTTTAKPVSFHPSLLGNLFLSSCPGKKVRLDGFASGRNGVSRDIDMDLKRIKDLGVGCIICCLDDEELSFLGIPWPNYQSSACDIGIDISRLPMPEGLAPLDPALLDDVLLTVINNYTLHGTPVLVHCRGGVGRAGVVACCWLIRLGLCGWIQEEMDQALCDACRASDMLSSATESIGNIHQVLHYLRQVIGIVRSRRSTKAVETYEQVKFLVEYVEYLRQR